MSLQRSSSSARSLLLRSSEKLLTLARWDMFTRYVQVVTCCPLSKPRLKAGVSLAVTCKLDAKKRERKRPPRKTRSCTTARSWGLSSHSAFPHRTQLRGPPVVDEPQREDFPGQDTAQSSLCILAPKTSR